MAGTIGVGVRLPLSGSGELVAVRRVRRHLAQAELASPRRCRDKQQGKGEDVYIGIGTVLAIVLIIVLLIWIF